MSLSIREVPLISGATSVPSSWNYITKPASGGHDHPICIVVDNTRIGSSAETLYIDGSTSSTFATYYPVPLTNAAGTNVTSVSLGATGCTYYIVQGYHKYLRARFTEGTTGYTLSVTAEVVEES